MLPSVYIGFAVFANPSYCAGGGFADRALESNLYLNNAYDATCAKMAE